MNTVEGSSSKKLDPKEESSPDDNELSVRVLSLEESDGSPGAIGLLRCKSPGCLPCLVVVELTCCGHDQGHLALRGALCFRMGKLMRLKRLGLPPFAVSSQVCMFPYCCHYSVT